MQKAFTKIFILIYTLTSAAGWLLNFQYAHAAILNKAPNNLGLVGYWPLNEGGGTVASDHSGKGNNGSLVNSPVWTTGKRGGGLLLSNPAHNGSFVSVPNFDYGVMRQGYETASWTMAIWARQTPGNGGENVLIGRDGCNGGIYTYNGGYAFAIKTDACWTNSQSIYATPANMDAWHHLVAVYNNRAMTFYVDGVSAGTATFSVTMNAYATTLGVGSGGGSYYAFNGALDDARVYNRALSGSEVSALYQAGEVRRVAADNTGLVGYWSLNDGGGTIATDFSGNGYSGTVSTGTSWIDGKRGKALSFSGSGFVDAGTAMAGVWPGLTISAWVNPSSYASWRAIVQPASTGDRALYLQGSYLQLYSSCNSSGTVPLNTWTHVVATVDGSNNIVYYINGQASGGCAGNIGHRTVEYLHISGVNTGDTENFQGGIDEVRVYNRALSAAEASKLYQSGATNVNSSRNSRLTSGLVGLWSFDGPDVSGSTAYDRSGSGNNGTIVGAFPKSGKIGQAMYFDSTWEYIGGQGPSKGSGLTLAAWIKPTAYPGERSTIILGDQYYLSLYADGSINTYWYGTSPAGYHSTAAGVVPLNEWTYALATWDGSNMKIYINGQLSTTVSVPNLGNDPAANALKIGAESAGRQFYGWIDDARIYNRALSASEVMQLYSLGK